MPFSGKPTGFPDFFLGKRVANLGNMCIFATNMIMEMEKTEKKNFFIKLLEDKKAMRECIQNGGDVNKTAKEHGIKLVTPL